MEKQRILIVDDDENIAELISLYLLKECFATEIAYTGKDALALAATFNPDLILLDIMLLRRHLHRFTIQSYSVVGHIDK